MGKNITVHFSEVSDNQIGSNLLILIFKVNFRIITDLSWSKWLSSEVTFLYPKIWIWVIKAANVPSDNSMHRFFLPNIISHDCFWPFNSKTTLSWNSMVFKGWYLNLQFKDNVLSSRVRLNILWYSICEHRMDMTAACMFCVFKSFHQYLHV